MPAPPFSCVQRSLMPATSNGLPVSKRGGCMVAWRAFHLTVLALVGFCKTATGRRVPSAARKIAAKRSLATSPQSCILRSHSIRRLTKLPHQETARASASTSGRTMMHHHVLSYAKSLSLAGLLAVAVASAAHPQKYDPGATDTEIKIGNIMPYSGPASAYATIGKTEAAYFNKINAEGGINGRKINFISYDDGYVPSKTVEQRS